jgi:hypothetical protein
MPDSKPSRETVDRNCEGIALAVTRKLNRENAARRYRLSE